MTALHARTAPLTCALTLALLTVPGAAAAESELPRSRPLGKPWAGSLVHGVQLPASGASFETWDDVLGRKPNRGWRRWGTDRLIALVIRVADEYRVAHPDAPPMLIGDISRRQGGDFGERFGGLGHSSHQNGLDVDVYYPRRDRVARGAWKAAQVDRALAQELVDRFVAAGAEKVYVGPRVGLTGPRAKVFRLVHHDDHLHVRLRNWQPRRGPL